MKLSIRTLVLSGAATSVAWAQEITTSGDHQLGLVWSGIARDAGLSMSVVENGTVTGMRKAAQGEVDMVGVGAPHFSTP